MFQEKLELNFWKFFLLLQQKTTKLKIWEINILSLQVYNFAQKGRAPKKKLGFFGLGAYLKLHKYRMTGNIAIKPEMR